MSAAWLAFARTGDLNGPGLPEWPPFSEESRSTMFLDLEPHIGDVPRREQLELCSRYYAGWGAAAV